MKLSDIGILESIERPKTDLEGLSEKARFETPRELASPAALEDRRRFIAASLGDNLQAELLFERVIGGDELQPINYLERGTVAAQSVGVIVNRNSTPDGAGFGTAFLIAPGVLITNHHVLHDAAESAASAVKFRFEIDLADQPVRPVVFELQPERLFFSSPQDQQDFTIVAVAPRSTEGAHAITEFGQLPLLDVSGKAAAGEWLTLIQHPDGGNKKICVRENQLLKRGEEVLWYSSDTLPGSSGSPVFNNDWYVVALHHKSIPEMKNGVIQSHDGRDYDSRTMSGLDIKWIANEGIRASRIAQTLKKFLPNEPLLKPMFAATPVSARIVRMLDSADLGQQPAKETKTMSAYRIITVPVEIRLDTDTGQATISGGMAGPISHERTGSPAAVDSATGQHLEAKFEAPFDEDYASRKGYDQAFLGNGDNTVPLPKLGALAPLAAQLLQPAGGDPILHYHNYSVVMHKKRRFAIYSAANISYGGRFLLNRPTDNWRLDPRISSEYQVENWYYRRNKFDRGHLTRREDLEYGASVDQALISASDTCHWTNCTPQHERFNQNREIWQGIERHVLEDSIVHGQLNAQIITGPVLDEGDPEYHDIQYPLQFWKVVAALDAQGKLFATAYLASQEGVISQYGIEVVEAPFGPFKTFQIKIAEVERLTGLNFMRGADAKKHLRDCDPLNASRVAGRTPRTSGELESIRKGYPTGYIEIRTLDDIRFRRER